MTDSTKPGKLRKGFMSLCESDQEYILSLAKALAFAQGLFERPDNEDSPERPPSLSEFPLSRPALRTP